MPKYNVSLTFNCTFQLTEIEAETQAKAEQFTIDLATARLNGTTEPNCEFEYEDISTDNEQFETEEAEEDDSANS